MLDDEAVAGGVGFPARCEAFSRPVRHVVECVDLPVRVVDCRADFAAGILEDEHMINVVASAEGVRALGPRVDEFAEVVRVQRAESCVVLARIEHHFATVVGHRGPAVGDHLHRVRL